MKKITLFVLILMSGFFSLSCRSEEDKALRAALNPYEIIALSPEERADFIATTEERLKTISPEENNTKAFWKIALAYGLVAEGRSKEALISFEEAFNIVEGLASYPQFYYYAGVAAAMEAKKEAIESQKALLFEKAIYFYNRAIEISSIYANAYYGLGVIYYFELNDLDLGLEYALKATRADEKHFSARYMAARIYIEKGENAKALEQYQFIIRHGDKETAASAVRNKEILEADG